MVAQAGGYYGTEFMGERGVTQGDPLSPTIFNVVVDAVVRHWVQGVVEEVEAQGETGQEGRHQAALFCADDGMVALLGPVWLQGAFNALVGLFDRVGLQTNVGKTVRMVCHPCQAAVNITQVEYGRRLTGEGKSYRERQRDWVECKEFGFQLVVGSLSIHLMTRHGKAAGQRRQWTTPTEGRVSQEYWISFPAKGGPRRYPMEGCPGKLATRTAMRVHFVHWHVLDTVLILEERIFPHPRCARCDMQVPRRALNGRHPGTARCAKGAEIKRRRLVETETRENSERAFEAYEAPIESVSGFKYLGRILTETDDDWPAVVGNLRKERRSWGRLTRVLSREGADPKV